MKSKLNNTRFIIFCTFVLLFTLIMPALAAQNSSVPSNIQSTLDKIVGVFTSNAIRAILMIAMGALAVGMLLTKDNQAAKKQFITWLVACGILTGLSTIVDWFIG
jgi:hypothetical protein